MVVLSEDRERLRLLMTETITLLCKNGLKFKSEFSISALVGITLDQNEVFLVEIKETVRNENIGNGCKPVTHCKPSNRSPTPPKLSPKRARKRRKPRSLSGSSGDESSGEPVDKVCLIDSNHPDNPFKKPSATDIKREQVSVVKDDVEVKNELNIWSPSQLADSTDVPFKQVSR